MGSFYRHSVGWDNSPREVVTVTSSKFMHLLGGDDHDRHCFYTGNRHGKPVEEDGRGRIRMGWSERILSAALLPPPSSL